ncbi:MAG: hypothetical protein Q8S33_38245 [Myxococcales bacterium]|nr:hypothetical protein [Myxococcales bacterium]
MRSLSPFAFLFFLATGIVLAVSCGPTKPACGPGTCQGCCSTSTGQCEAGMSLAACGKNGTTCSVCQLGATCQFGQCMGNSSSSGGGSGSTGGGFVTGGGAAGGGFVTGGGATGGGFVTGGGASGGGSVTGGGATGGGFVTGGGASGGSVTGGGTTGGGFVTGGGASGGSVMGGGTGGSGPRSTTITAVQTGLVGLGECVRVTGVAMSAVFSDPDDAVVLDGGARVPRQAFYLSERGLSITVPHSGIEVVSTLAAPPTAAVGDDLVVVGEYFENFDNSTLRLTPTCGSVTRLGATTVPQPAFVTIAAVGQSGGSPGCPVLGSPWFDGTSAEAYEGVLVRVQSGAVSAGLDSFGAFEVSSGGDKVLVSNHFGLTTNPSLGGAVTSITGFGHFSFCRRKLRPRNDAEVVIGAGALCGSGARTNHLVISEVAVTPTAGEFIEVWNPTAAAISLTTVRVYNASFPGSDAGVACQYPFVVSGGACGTGPFGDFNLQFPAGATIAPGEFQTIAITGAPNFCTSHSCATARPTYELVGVGQVDDPLVANMLGDFDNRAGNFVGVDGGSGLGFLTNGGEEVVLYSWDGVSSTVRDLDYVIWGTGFSYRVDKSTLPGYQPDTAIGLQRPAVGAASANASYQRVCSNESAERKTGGNGVTGHDETSEDLDVSWALQTPTPRAQTNGALP